ncbi:hypothetical protein Tco_0744416 [Tanacetum coccineum]
MGVLAPLGGMVTGRSGVPRNGDRDMDGECICDGGADTTGGVFENVILLPVFGLLVCGWSGELSSGERDKDGEWSCEDRPEVVGECTDVGVTVKDPP